MFSKQALTIGVNSYVPSRLVLKPCINDARDLSRSLRSIGFQVKTALDADLQTMQTVTDRFIKSIQPGAVVLYYFSGHGVQYAGRNYLIPTNALGVGADNIASTAVDAQAVINAMHSRRPRLVICILDCCRTDPPAEPIDGYSFHRNPLAGTKAGFAVMEVPPSTIVAYACAADEAASAKSRLGRNSLYTSHLLRYITAPNADVETILRYAAIDVQNESENEQIPFRYSSCNELIYLVSGMGVKGLNAPHHYTQMRPTIHSFYNPYQKALPFYHSQPRAIGYQYPLTGHFGYPIHRSPVDRNFPSHMLRIPSRSHSLYARDLRHYRR